MDAGTALYYNILYVFIVHFSPSMYFHRHVPTFFQFQMCVLHSKSKTEKKKYKQKKKKTAESENVRLESETIRQDKNIKSHHNSKNP